MAGKGGMFDSIRLHRQQPWKRDGAQRTEIYAGNVDSSGKFRGIAFTDVHLQALLRYFHLGPTCLPAALPPQVADMAQALEQGFPTIVLTRGLWGRELDNGLSPCSNMNQDNVWMKCRKARADNPRLLVTCVDIPHDLDADEVEAVLREPLNEYRELMYHDGTWYTPTVESAAHIARQLKELNGGKESALKQKKEGVNFNRKKFEWRQDESVNVMYNIVWKSLLEVRPPEAPIRRTDLDFTDRKESKAFKEPASWAAARLKQDLAKADDVEDKVAAVGEFLKGATSDDEAALKEALATCKDAADSLKKKKKDQAALAMKHAAAVLQLQRNYEGAADMANDLQDFCKDSKDAAGQMDGVVAGMKAYVSLRKIDDAVKVATKAQAAFNKSGDKDEEVACVKAAVNTQLEQGEYDGAVKTASAARDAFKKAKSQKQEGQACLLLGDAHAAKDETEDALKAREDARAAFKGAKDKDAEFEALEAIFSCQEPKDLLDTAKAMKSLGVSKAHAQRYLAAAHLATCEADRRSLSDGDQEEMVDAAKSAVSDLEGSDDKIGLATAQATYAAALLAAASTQDYTDVALSQAQAAVAGFQAAGGARGASQALQTCVKANIVKGNAYSAMWDAKRIVTNAQSYGDQNMVNVGMNLLQEASAMVNKDVQVGPFVPVSVSGQDGNMVMYV